MTPVKGWVWCEQRRRPSIRCADQDGHTCSQPLCPHRDCPGPHYAVFRSKEKIR